MKNIWQDVTENILLLAALITSMGIVARFLWGPVVQLGKRYRDLRYALDRIDPLLLDSETLFLALDGLDLNSGVWQSSADGRCMRASRGLQSLMGASEDEILGFGWRNLIHPDDRDRVEQRFMRAVEDRAIFDDVYRFARTGYQVHVRCVPHYSASGRLIGFGSFVVRLPDPEGTAP